ncbi:MAG: hypothetical protein AB7E95_00515 [Kiritimatiellales bacterium]
MNKRIKAIAFIGCLTAFLFCFSGYAETLFSDDLSTLRHFKNIYSSVPTVSWITDGNNAVFTGGAASSDRARLESAEEFKFMKQGTTYKSVTLTFTSRIDKITEGRFEIGLIEAKSVRKYNNPLFLKNDMYGAVVCHTSSSNPLGLLFNAGDGTAPGPTANDIGTAAVTGEHTYSVVFTPTGTELFRDGESQGTTGRTLDFSKRYKIAVFGQGRSSNSKQLGQIDLNVSIQ